MTGKMNELKKFILTCLIFVFFIMVISCAVSFYTQNKKSAYAIENATIVSSEIADSYSYNITFDVPSVKLLTNEGEEIICNNAALIYPDGIARGGQSHKLSQLGEYRIIYSTGKYSASKNFEVLDKNWSVSSSASSAEYVDSLEYSNMGKSGISVDLAYGDTFTYNVPFNLYESDNLVDLIRCYPVSHGEIGTDNNCEVHAVYFIVKLIDCYNPNNFIEFYMWTSGVGSKYVGAGASNQSMTGCESLTDYVDGAYEKDGNFYRVRYVDRQYIETHRYGTPTPGRFFNDFITGGGLNFQMDPYENEIYTSVYKYNSAANVESLTTRRFVTDLDADEIYTNMNEKTFGGFTTGEVYLQISGQLFKSASIHFEIESIFGREGAELQNNNYVDNIAPKINFKNSEIIDKTLYAQKGKIIKLPIPEVSDVNYNGAMSVSVYSNYGTNYETLVAVDDFAFAPNKRGFYTAVYEVKDFYGNITVAELNFTVLEEPIIVFEENKLDNLTAGEDTLLPEISATSLNGQLECKICIICPDGSIINIDNENQSFVPEYTGTFTVHYTLSDVLYEETFSYSLICEDVNNAVLFKSEIQTPLYFIKGASYVINDMPAYTVSDTGLVEQETETYIAVDGGEFRLVNEAEKDNYIVNANENIAIKFAYNGKFSDTKEVKVIDVGYTTSRGEDKMEASEFAKYFVNDNYEVKTSGASISYVFDGTSETETLYYANILSLSNFNFGFATNTLFDEGAESVYYDGFTKLEIKLIDVYDRSNTIRCTYEVEGNSLVYTVNGFRTRFSDENISDINDTIIVDLANRQLLNSKRGNCSIGNFTKDYCYLVVTLSGITDKSAVSIKKVCNQTFSKNMNNIGKSLFNYEAIGGVFDQGESYTVKKAQVSNVLFPVFEENVKITVKDGEQNIVTDVNGVLLNNVANGEYTFKLNNIGSYTVIYSIKTPIGTTDTSSMLIKVIDCESPIITFENGIGKDTLIQINVNTKHIIKSFTVCDNYSDISKITATVIVYNSANLIRGIGVTEVTFTERGDYKVMVFAIDEQGNSAIEYYNVKVV